MTSCDPAQWFLEWTAPRHSGTIPARWTELLSSTIRIMGTSSAGQRARTEGTNSSSSFIACRQQQSLFLPPYCTSRVLVCRKHFFICEDDWSPVFDSRGKALACEIVAFQPFVVGGRYFLLSDMNCETSFVWTSTNGALWYSEVELVFCFFKLSITPSIIALNMYVKKDAVLSSWLKNVLKSFVVFFFGSSVDKNVYLYAIQIKYLFKSMLEDFRRHLDTEGHAFSKNFNLLNGVPKVPNSALSSSRGTS